MIDRILTVIVHSIRHYVKQTHHHHQSVRAVWKGHAREALPQLLSEILRQHSLVAAWILPNSAVRRPALKTVAYSRITLRLAVCRTAIPGVRIRVAVNSDRTAPHLDVVVVCVHAVHPNRRISFLAMVVKYSHVGPRAPEREARVCMAAAIFGADCVWLGAKPWVSPYVVPENNILRAVARVVLVLKPWTEGSLRPMRVQIIRSVTDLTVLHQPILVATVEIHAICPTPPAREVAERDPGGTASLVCTPRHCWW